MQLIKSIVCREKVKCVKEALGRLEVARMTVTEVGEPEQRDRLDRHRGDRSHEALTTMEIEALVPDSMAPTVVRAIIVAARMGEGGAGRVLVTRVAHSYQAHGVH